jgi:hypothetical protein
MGETEQPQPAGTGATGAGAAAELAEIGRRQQQVIRAALVPVWYWWLMGADGVAIGAARDSHNHLVLAITIPLAALVFAVQVIATIPGVRRRVRVHADVIPSAQAAVAIPALILLVGGVTTVVSVSLIDHRVPHPLTIGYAAGAAALVIAGPLLNRYFGRLMLSNARQHITDAPDGGTPWHGLLSSDPGDHSADHLPSTGGRGTR